MRKAIHLRRPCHYGYLAALNTRNGTLEIYDTDETAQDRRLAVVRVGLEPVSVRFEPRARRLYVTNFLGDSISVIALSAAGGPSTLRATLLHTTPVGDEQAGGRRRSRLRALVTPARRGKRVAGTGPGTEPEKRRAMTWARRLKRVFRIDIDTCVVCGAAVKIIACIPYPDVIRRILDHLKRTGALTRKPPPQAPRAPPSIFFGFRREPHFPRVEFPTDTYFAFYRLTDKRPEDACKRPLHLPPKAADPGEEVDAGAVAHPKSVHGAYVFLADCVGAET